MKKYIIALIIISYIPISISQNISIELHISWKTSTSELDTLYSGMIPYLEILYKNSSTTPYYFFKGIKCDTKYPPIGTANFIHLSLKNLLTNLPDYHSDNFNVWIGSNSFIEEAWYILNDSVNPQEVHESDFINDELKLFYNHISGNINAENGLKFTQNDLLPENLHTIKDYFVFLKPGETHTDSFNLIGFLLFKGNYNFRLSFDYLDNFVLLQKWDEKKNKIITYKTPFPPYIKEYKLYTGTFNTNTLGVSFK